MKKLWDKNSSSKPKTAAASKIDAFIERFETKDDLLLDQKLLKFDVYGSLAHAKMLRKIGILSEKELKTIQKGLLEILKKEKRGEFVLTFGDEDIHTKIENFLTENVGCDAGKKVHTGRSRNDQVLTAIRLFTKDELITIWEHLLTLTDNFLAFAKEHEFVPMPGYTHMQKAMPSSIGMWAGAFAQNLADDLILLQAAFKLNDQSPLGSAAGYGVPLPLDRAYTQKLLGFERLQSVAVSSQNSRGKIEAAITAALSAILFDLSKFASDVLLYTTSEFNFLQAADNLCTGSSIMPQKRNVDIAELLRSKVHLMVGNYVQIMGIGGNLISGYHRDLQDTKKPFFESLEIASDSIQIAHILITNSTPREDILEKAMTPELFATHKALELVTQGMPFREAYQTVGSQEFDFEVKNIPHVLKQSTHLGGTGNLGLSQLKSHVQKEQKTFQKTKKEFESTINNLLKSA